MEALENTNETGMTPIYFDDDPFPVWDADLAKMIWPDSEDDCLSYGLYGLDRVLNGLHRGDLILFAGKMGCGKSDFAETLAHTLAWRQKATGIFFVLGTKARYTLAGITAIHARMAYNAVLRNCDEAEANQAKARAAIQELSEMRLLLDDRCGLSLIEIEERIRTAKKQFGITFAIVNKWQMFANPYEIDSNGLRYMKRLAMDLDIPIVLFARMSKATAKRLTVEDVGECGFYDDPDVIALMHLDDKEKTGELLFQVVKNRNGGSGMIRTAYINYQHRVENLAIAQ